MPPACMSLEMWLRIQSYLQTIGNGLRDMVDTTKPSILRHNSQQEPGDTNFDRSQVGRNPDHKRPAGLKLKRRHTVREKSRCTISTHGQAHTIQAGMEPLLMSRYLIHRNQAAP